MAGQVYNIPVMDAANRPTILSQGLLLGYLAAGINANIFWGTMTPGLMIAFYIEGGRYGYWANNQTSSVITRYQALSATVASVQTYDYPAGLTNGGFSTQPTTMYVEVYPSSDEAYKAITGQGGVPIKYILSGCTTSGPQSASSGERVTIPITPESGKIIRNPVQGGSISVYSSGGYIPFVFSNNSISFTVP